MSGPNKEGNVSRKANARISPTQPSYWPGLWQQPDAPGTQSIHEASLEASVLRSLLARQQTDHSFNNEAGQEHPLANTEPSNSHKNAETQQAARDLVSEPSLSSSEKGAREVPFHKAKQTTRDVISRYSSLNSERRLGVSRRPSMEGILSRTASVRDQTSGSRRPSLETLHEYDRSAKQVQRQRSLPGSQSSPPMTLPQRRQPVRRHSSLRNETRPSDEDLVAPRFPSRALGGSASNSLLSAGNARPKSHPPSRSPAPGQGQGPDKGNGSEKSEDLDCPNLENPWRLPPLPRSTPQTPRLAYTSPSRPPSLTFKRLSSLDQLISYREDRDSWKRESYVSARRFPDQVSGAQETSPTTTAPATDNALPYTHEDKIPATVERGLQDTEGPSSPQSKFRHFAAEVGFCFTIAMTQLLAEYLISGFAVVLPNLFDASSEEGAGMTGHFWPAALLSLILSAFLLVFARVSDMYGGYGPFMFGLIWLTIWTLVPGFISSSLLLNISRAMQGLAIAAFTPSTFSMVGSIYSEGPRRNVVLGLYGACAPLGFFAGFLAGGALPVTEAKWYFWIASALAFITTITAYLSVPYDRTDRKRLNLKMDWLGAFLITSGLILMTYALSVQPYANVDDPEKNGFAFRIVYTPLSSGAACLALAFWVEGWYASCPLLPFEFFKPTGVKPLSIACLFFYGSFGVWLYNSAEFFVSPSVTEDPDSIKGIVLSLWYTPMAVGGMVFCIVGGALLHIVPIKLLMIISGLAWIGTPLVFAVGPIPLGYWSEVLPSMICGTLGIDLTFTIAAIFLSSSQPLKFQGVAGAVSSILVNLAMSFSLPISLIVKEAATDRVLRSEAIDSEVASTVWGFRAAFIYGAVSAGCGLLVCVFFVRISRSVVSGKKSEMTRRASEASHSTASTILPADDARHSQSV